jgi:hypothetical protein
MTSRANNPRARAPRAPRSPRQPQSTDSPLDDATALPDVEFYATITPDQVKPYMAPTTLMVTATGYWRTGAKGDAIPPVVLPADLLADVRTTIAADSGGFEAAYRYGKYPFSFEAYVRWLSTIPNLTWAALPDLPVEKQLARTYENVRQRQELTLAYARDFWAEYTENDEIRQVPWTWVPTIQGRTVDDYVWMAEELAPLLLEQMSEYAFNAYGWDRYDSMFNDTDAERAALFAKAERHDRYWRVGIGSLCKRKSMRQVVDIVGALVQRLPECKFHLWGVALGAMDALRVAGLLGSIASFDTGAFNQRWYAGQHAHKAVGMTQREYTWKVAWPAYRAKVDAALGRARPDHRQAVLI